MTVLDTRVQQRLPVAVVALSGGLDEATVGQAEAALWECLAQMPNAMIIDAAGLDIEPAGWRWFADLRHRAARWPGGALCLAGFQGPLEEPAFDHFPSVPLALAAQPSDPHERRRDLVLPPHPRSCALARELVITACADWGLNRTKRLAELLISEMVANGVRHARTELVVTVRLRGRAFEMSVHDQSPLDLPPLAVDPRGFGLQLMNELSERWGWVRAGRGKVVWSQLPGVGSG